MNSKVQIIKVNMSSRKSSAKKISKSSKKINHESAKFLSLTSIENFFFKIISKNKALSSSIKKTSLLIRTRQETKETNNNQASATSSYDDNRIHSNGQCIKYTGNQVDDDEEEKQLKLVKNLLPKLSTSNDNFDESSQQQTSILKYLLDSYSKTSLNPNTREEEAREEIKTDDDNQESDDSYLSTIIHESSTSENEEDTNQTFLIHNEIDEDKLTSLESNASLLANVKETIILRALLESYPNFLRKISNSSIFCSSSNSPNQTNQSENQESNDSNSSVIIHDDVDECEQSSGSHDEINNLDSTTIVHNDEKTDVEEDVNRSYNLNQSLSDIDFHILNNFSLEQLENLEDTVNVMFKEQCHNIHNQYLNYTNELLRNLNENE